MTTVDPAWSREDFDAAEEPSVRLRPASPSSEPSSLTSWPARGPEASLPRAALAASAGQTVRPRRFAATRRRAAPLTPPTSTATTPKRPAPPHPPPLAARRHAAGPPGLPDLLAPSPLSCVSRSPSEQRGAPLVNTPEHLGELSTADL
jgi:hypothetical protein